MGLIVQKYGGSSLATLDRIQAIAERIQQTKVDDDLVIVLSAMGDTTDELIVKANTIDDKATCREYDALLATGEQISTALMAMALNKLGVPARSMTGWQAGMHTDTSHKKARIVDIATERIHATIKEGVIPVVTGFQGINKHGDITTLGRGGSDTTAVALAAALHAQECQIYTDVAGVYTADPRVVDNARLMSCVTFEEMLELASLGAKVLQIRAVEFAGKYNVPLRVLSSFELGQGTLITYEDEAMEQALVSGIAHDRNQAQLTISGIPNQPTVASQVLGAVSEHNIDVDMIVQDTTSPDGKTSISFTVQREDYDSARAVLESLLTTIPGEAVTGDDKIAKLSIVGVGMRSHAGVATTMFEALGREGINIKLITTSEIKLSVVIDEKYLELGVRTLHSSFNLQETIERQY